MRMCATRCMPALSGCSSQSHSHWERGGGPCSPFRVFPSSFGASSTRRRSCAEIFGGTRSIAKGCVIVSFRIFGKKYRRKTLELAGNAASGPGNYPEPKIRGIGGTPAINHTAMTASKIMQPNEDVGMNGQMGLPQTWCAISQEECISQAAPMNEYDRRPINAIGVTMAG